MAITTYTGIALTSGGANTKGGYTQIVASTPYASSRVFVVTEFASASIRFMLLDIATGGAGAETVVAADLALDTNSDSLPGVFLPLDVDVPAGTRLSARLQATTAAATLTIYAYLDSRAVAGLAAPVTYGTVLGSSRGTQIDPGGTANTKSAYVQFSASTPSRTDALLLCLTIGTAGTNITPGVVWTIDVATGAAGSEVIVLADLEASANSASDAVRPGLLRLPVVIAAGTRLAVRVACTTNTATVRLINITLVGMQEPATSGGSTATSVAYLG